MKNVEQYREEYLAFLKEQLKEKCNSDMQYEVYWDYRDELDPSTLREVLDDYKEKGYETPYDYLVKKLHEQNFDYDLSLFNEIKKEIKGCDNEHVVAYYQAYGGLYGDTSEVGYNGINVMADELLEKSEFCVNVMFATETERNYDMGSIVNAFGSYREPDFDYLANNIDDLDNALTYLIHQQGHSVKEVYACLLGNPRGFGSGEEMDFAKSVVDDIVNNSSEAMSELCALVKLDGKKLLELFETIEKGGKYLTFAENTDIGIFNEWAGCGGLLEIKLDKPFVVPASMVRNIQIEGAENRGYTVDSVYGLVGGCWKETLGYTGEKPVLYEEDLEATIKSVQTYLNPFELKKFDLDYDFIATIQNNTDSVLKFSFDENLGLKSFEIKPNCWVDLICNEDDVNVLNAIEDGNYQLDIIEVKPSLDSVIKSCADKVDKASVSDAKDIDINRE